jgi:hypothetical protein
MTKSWVRRLLTPLAGTLFWLAGCEGRPLPESVIAHSLVYQFTDGGNPRLSALMRARKKSGGILLASVGRGDVSTFSAPYVRNGASAFEQLGSVHTYAHYKNSGTALYASTVSATPRRFHINVDLPPDDEVTLAAIEIAGTRVQDFVWSEVLDQPVTSGKVTTTGPATLVAFWWGDAGVAHDKTAEPNNGFRVVDAILRAGPLVQCAVAVKRVEAAGTYDVTWTATPRQGAQLWLVAVE